MIIGATESASEDDNDTPTRKVSSDIAAGLERVDSDDVIWCVCVCVCVCRHSEVQVLAVYSLCQLLWRLSSLLLKNLSVCVLLGVTVYTVCACVQISILS